MLKIYAELKLEVNTLLRSLTLSDPTSDQPSAVIVPAPHHAFGPLATTAYDYFLKFGGIRGPPAFSCVCRILLH
jgi:hypothetical protein